jgi:hypothetical protein|tara:strand:- start:268 stop:468 length:201 start_codon:yes stop_codon:yes gene_type:complete
MKEYVDELMKGFDGDYLDFCNYVYKVLDKKLSMNKNDPKYKQIQINIFQYIVDNKVAISKKLKKSK